MVSIAMARQISFFAYVLFWKCLCLYIPINIFKIIYQGNSKFCYLVKQ